MKKLLLLSLLTSIFLAIFACTPSQPSEFRSLIGQGPIPVSPSNAFVGGNLFLTKEFEKSPVLYKFLKGRGAPLAVEIKDDRNIKLYYPREREYFQASLVQGETIYNWITRGPFRMNREDFLKVSELAKIKDEPIFQSRGKTFRFKEVPTPIPTPFILPTSTPVAKLKKKKSGTITAPSSITLAPPTPSAAPTVFTYDQMAIQMSRGYAERTQTGDVVHTTKKEGESLRDIAAWYTGSPDNAEAIASRNNIPLEGVIISGARITIPQSMVKEFKAMK